jgi:hypothetical protein
VELSISEHYRERGGASENFKITLVRKLVRLHVEKLRCDSLLHIRNLSGLLKQRFEILKPLRLGSLADFGTIEISGEMSDAPTLPGREIYRYCAIECMA